MTAIKPPVFVREKSAGRQVIREVRDIETAGQVHRSWQGRGSAWRTAASVISEALHGRETPDAARRAFVSAAREEGVLIVRE